MRSIRLDAYEFESACSEEALELDISHRSAGEYSTLWAFAAALAIDVPAAVLTAGLRALTDVLQHAMLCEHLQRYAQITVSEPAHWQVYLLDEMEWNDVTLLIVSPAYFIHYHWSTSA